LQSKTVLGFDFILARPKMIDRVAARYKAATLKEETMETLETGASRQVQGQVKWFDPGKGFGFVVADNGGRDILLHANVLRNFGQGSVVDGSAISILVQDTERGLQAIEVLSIHPPESQESVPLRDMVEFTADDISNRPIEPARVKWFDKGKGFGFANVFGNNDDVFIHVEVLRHSGLSDLQSGEAVGLRMVDGERGRMAIQIIGWEAAAK
jgi:CspA family cold shock protein